MTSALIWATVAARLQGKGVVAQGMCDILRVMRNEGLMTETEHSRSLTQMVRFKLPPRVRHHHLLGRSTMKDAPKLTSQRDIWVAVALMIGNLERMRKRYAICWCLMELLSQGRITVEQFNTAKALLKAHEPFGNINDYWWPLTPDGDFKRVMVCMAIASSQSEGTTTTAPPAPVVPPGPVRVQVGNLPSKAYFRHTLSSSDRVHQRVDNPYIERMLSKGHNAPSIISITPDGNLGWDRCSTMIYPCNAQGEYKP